MDAQATAAVDILIRTSMGNAHQSFTRELGRIESEAKAFAARMKGILGNLGFGMSGGGSPGGSRSSGFAGNAAIADMARMQNERARMEADVTRRVGHEANAQREARTKAFKSSMDDIIKQLDVTDRQGKSATSGNSFFSGTFWGTLGGNIAASFINRIAQIPSDLKGILDEAVKIAQERQLALAGLASVATAKGVDDKSATEAVRNLRLVKSGVVDLGNATTALKNLLATGFSLPESIKLLEAFSDTAAFGKQAALTYGEAIRGATEGIKNQNSILVDNVGLTKNLSVILKELGYDEKDLNRVSQDLGVRQALLNGLLKEAAINTGDADKLTTTYTGSVASLDMAYQNLYAAGGKILIQNPQLIESNKILTEQINGHTMAVNNANSATHKFITEATNLWAQFKVGIIAMLGSIGAAIASLVTGLAAGLGALLILVSAPIEATLGGLMYLIDQAREKIISLINFASETVRNNPALQLVPGLSTLGAVPTIPNPKVGPFADYMPITRELGEAVYNLSMTTKNLFNLSNRLGREGDAAMRRVANVGNQPQADDWADRFNLPLARPPITPSTGAGTEEEKAKKKKAASDTDSRTDKQVYLDFVKALKDEGIFIGKGQGFRTEAEQRALYNSLPRGQAARPGTSDHEFYRGLDLPAGVSDEIVERAARKAQVILGKKLIHQGTGLHRHQPFKKGKFDGGGEEDISKTMREQSDLMTQMEREKNDARALFFFRKFPELAKGKSETLDRIAKTEAEKTGVAQPQDIEARNKLLGIQQKQLEAIAQTETKVSTEVTNRLTLDQQHVKNLEDSLNFGKRTEFLLLRQRNITAEISLLHRDSILAGWEEEVELQVRSGLLRAQNADANFVAQRQANRASAERLDLEQQITDLLDEQATIDINAPLRIHAALLQDIAEIRGRETQAVIDSNRAILELNQQTIYSAAQADAGVRQYLASQKGVTETMRDFKIGLVESGYDLIDRGLDRVIPKLGRISETIKDLLSSLIRLWLMPAFRRLFGGEGASGGPASAGGAASGTGGIGGFIRNLLFGRQGAGGGTTGTTGASGATGAGIGGFNFGVPGGTGTFAGQPVGLGGGSNPFFAGLPGMQGNLLPTVGGAPTSNPIQTALNAANAAEIGGPGGSNLRTAGMSGAANQAAWMTQIGGALTGGMMGAQLGQGSGIGSIMGGVGGAIAGTLLSGLLTTGSIAGATTGGMFGATAGLFGLSGAATLGIGFAIGGALMLGAWLFGRAAKRKKEKREVTALSGEALTKVRQLIEDVKAFKIDGQSGYNQGVQIRDQFAEEIKKLKTGPGKRLAQQKLGEINSLLTQLKAEADRSDRIKAIAQRVDESVVPTFASGGMGGFTGLSYGSRMVQMHAPEIVLNTSQIAALGGYREVQRRANIPGMNLSGAPDRYDRSRAPVATSGSSTSSDDRPMFIAAYFDEDAADAAVDHARPFTVAKKVRVATHTKDDAGLFESLEKRFIDGD